MQSTASRPELPEDILDQLAAIEHERWAHWQQYVHSHSHRREDGSLTIPPELVARWERLIATKYADLTDEERKSDLDQVQRYLPTLLLILPKHAE